MMLLNSTVTVFFSYNTSLDIWSQSGLFEREVEIYRRLASNEFSVQFVTYGKNEHKYHQEIPQVKILSNQLSLPSSIYSRILAILHTNSIRKTHVIKTNQMNGAQHALRVAKIWKKPLIARMGYMWSLNRERQFGIESAEAQFAKRVEKKVFDYATSIIVTTNDIRDTITSRTPHHAPKIKIVPNYIDANQFCPNNGIKKEVDLIFVGRINEVKNIDKLLEALTSISDTKLWIIGDGQLRQTLEKQYKHLSNRVKWLGKINNEDLPLYLNKAKIYIQPSKYEGHPKTIIEAMACGLPVIGGDSPGIRNMIKHGETGWLTKTDPQSIRQAIQHLLNNPQLCDTLGQNAREFVVQEYSIDKIVNMEIEVIHSTIENFKRQK